MSIRNNLLEIREAIPENVSLVAVSKTKPNEDILEAYEAGQRIFGENKIQEMSAKQQALPQDIEWHMIGHVQTNKIKFMAPYVALVHGVDSLKLLQEIDKQAAKHQRVIACLLQVHIANEETKFGLDAGEVNELLGSETFRKMTNVEIKGLMGMASFTDDKRQIQNEFSQLKSLFDDLQRLPKTHNFNPEILSMGMSGDYSIAIACGSTMVRIGSSIFGTR
ncbi:YggS family pyridoxal phosphate-dependent enzyme [Flavobacterium selenitireducens]|uniref:YggS family pyridoxal phosphate-dependent enzyme n=1 Tax=Flavobacterium selenitireducens TaxID=2722704 RepID=UPI00168B4104|nr:YggS family pyridoxal phosphate-dependent enzyme [Flavobacterium selenitireducens]MBD3582964.1 YggS family pyridoxal phosphate-dependent enzyme [Flavobacterium selenitireducens]